MMRNAKFQMDNLFELFLNNKFVHGATAQEPIVNGIIIKFSNLGYPFDGKCLYLRWRSLYFRFVHFI